MPSVGARTARDRAAAHRIHALQPCLKPAWRGKVAKQEAPSDREFLILANHALNDIVVVVCFATSQRRPLEQIARATETEFLIVRRVNKM